MGISGWIIQTRKIGINKYNVTTTVFLLLITYPIVTYFTSDAAVIKISFAHSVSIWFGLFLFTVVTLLIPLILYFSGIREVQASSAGIYLLLEIPTAILLSTIYLNEVIIFNIILGGLFIICANYLLIKKGN